MSVHTIHTNTAEQPYLVVTVDSVQCALPLTHVAEISRPPKGELPTSIVLRGREMRLFDLPAMLGYHDAPRNRVVRLHLPEGREAALAVSTAPGAHIFTPEHLSALEVIPEAAHTPYPEAAPIYRDILDMLRAGGRLPDGSGQKPSSV